MQRLTVNQVAAELGVQPAQVRWFCKHDELPGGYVCKIMGSIRKTYYIWRLSNEGKNTA